MGGWFVDHPASLSTSSQVKGFRSTPLPINGEWSGPKTLGVEWTENPSEDALSTTEV